jgi:hypothetical protein
MKSTSVLLQCGFRFRFESQPEDRLSFPPQKWPSSSFAPSQNVSSIHSVRDHDAYLGWFTSTLSASRNRGLISINAISLVEPATCTCTAAQHLRAESNKNTVSYESENVKISRASLIISWLFFFRGVNVVFDDRLNKFQV